MSFFFVYPIFLLYESDIYIYIIFWSNSWLMTVLRKIRDMIDHANTLLIQNKCECGQLGKDFDLNINLFEIENLPEKDKKLLAVVIQYLQGFPFRKKHTSDLKAFQAHFFYRLKAMVVCQ